MTKMYSRAIRVALISIPYMACFMVIVGIPAFALGGKLAAQIALAAYLPISAAWIIYRDNKRHPRTPSEREKDHR